MYRRYISTIIIIIIIIIFLGLFINLYMFIWSKNFSHPVYEKSEVNPFYYNFVKYR